MSRSLYRVSPDVDNFLNAIINEGEVLSIDHLYIQVRYKSSNYFIWMPDLSACMDNRMDNYIYSHLSPSTDTKIRFWEWVETKSDMFSARKLPLSVRKIRRIMGQ